MKIKKQFLKFFLIITAIIILIIGIFSLVENISYTLLQKMIIVLPSPIIDQDILDNIITRIN